MKLTLIIHWGNAVWTKLLSFVVLQTTAAIHICVKMVFQSHIMYLSSNIITTYIIMETDAKLVLYLLPLDSEVYKRGTKELAKHWHLSPI